jgi:hypothetical protein
MTVPFDRRMDSAEAESLYQRADRVVLRATLTGMSLGAVVFGLIAVAGSRDQVAALSGLFLGAVIGTWLGRATGIERAFPLRFQAQQLLVQGMENAPTARRFT